MTIHPFYNLDPAQQASIENRYAGNYDFGQNTLRLLFIAASVTTIALAALHSPLFGLIAFGGVIQVLPTYQGNLEAFLKEKGAEHYLQAAIWEKAAKHMEALKTPTTLADAINRLQIKRKSHNLKPVIARYLALEEVVQETQNKITALQTQKAAFQRTITEIKHFLVVKENSLTCENAATLNPEIQKCLHTIETTENTLGEIHLEIYHLEESDDIDLSRKGICSGNLEKAYLIHILDHPECSSSIDEFARVILRQKHIRIGAAQPAFVHLYRDGKEIDRKAFLDGSVANVRSLAKQIFTHSKPE